MTNDLQRTSCSYCNSTEFRHVLNRSHFLIKCKNCGLVTTDFIPSETTLSRYYHSYPSYDKLSELTIARYHELLDKLEIYRQTNNLLEAGCGFGNFLVEAKKRNWNVFGTELSTNALLECRRKGIEVTDTLDPLFISHSKNFDAIVSLEVIEHLSDPVTETEMYGRLIRPGGVLYMTTPNFNSLSRRVLGSRWNVILYPEHIYYFTLHTLKKILNKYGFEKVKEETSGFSFARLLYAFKSKIGDKKVKDYDYNEKDRELRDAIEKTVILRLIKKFINSMLTFFKAGDTLKILYRKK
jgi:cyclopropane fatty-acyl-phospholipid synthase-like methyltransferase